MLQIEPMSRDIAVDVFDIEVVWILPERSRHRNGLFAAVAPAKAKWAGVSNLNAKVVLTAVILTA